MSEALRLGQDLIGQNVTEGTFHEVKATGASHNPQDTTHFTVIFLVIMDFSYYENVLTAIKYLEKRLLFSNIHI